MKTIKEIGLRPEIPELSYEYKVVYPDGSILSISPIRVKEFLNDDRCEVIRVMRTSSVEVDGRTYYRNRFEGIASPTFYTLKEDFSHVPDRDIHWDSAHQFRTKCVNCEKPWKMNEEHFLVYGEILCAYCGEPGQTVGSVW